MKDTAADLRVIERLSHALAMEALSSSSREQATHLLGRLSSPVRVSLLGLPGAGKSELLNLFAGERILPKDAGFATTELAWGDVPRVILTGADGAKSQMEEVDPDAIAALAPAFISIRRPLPILKRVRLLEPVARKPENMKAALDWAMRRTDIALWCTQKFDNQERQLWSGVPDALKDHAFLVLTKADVLSATGELTGRISGLSEVVAEEFHSMFAVATLQALKAFARDGTVDDRVFAASGGAALRAEVLKHADRGRRADFDIAEVFLVRNKIPEDVPQTPIEAATPSAPDSAPAAPKVETKAAPVSAPAPAPAPAVSKPVRGAQSLKAAPMAAPATAPEAAPEAPAVVAHDLENVTLFTNSAEFLRRRGDGLAEGFAAFSPGETTPLVENCMDAVEHLIDLFSEDDSGCPAADAFLDELNEATELMILMQLEDGDAPAADAVSLVLQLRRDIETKLAA